MGLTKKQHEVYRFVYEYFHTHNYSPTQEEIRQHFGLKSLGSVQKYLQYLTNAGYLQGDWNARRGLAPKVSLEKSGLGGEVVLPLLGRVAAGRPLEAHFNGEEMAVPAHLVRKGEHFLLQVQGQSMIDEGILDGDVIVVKKQSRAEKGQTVVALINNEATVKKYYRRKGRVELRAANENLSSFFLQEGDDLSIQGIVVGLIRRYL